VLGDLPTADFSFTLNAAQADFTSSSSGADSYLWDFGDGATSVDENPSYFYAVDGTYLVTLIVENECGSDTTTREVSIATSLRDGLGQTELLLQPNPNPGRFSLRFVGEPLSEVLLHLIDPRGKVVYREALGQVREGETYLIDRAGNLSEGIYLLRLQAAEGEVTRRVVIISR
jgi:PKD repeat protein